MRGKKLLAAFAAIYIIPYAILLVFTFAIFIFIGSQSEDEAQKVDMSSSQLYAMKPGITRKEVIDIALTLVNKVKYFWGGHSMPGWNPLWGTPMLVTAEGDWSSGTYQPYGLDCSGFIEWVFVSAGTNILHGTTASEWPATYEIKESELKPGDLVFEAPGDSSINHIGIFYKRENGVKYYIHCQGGTGVTINSTSVFKYWRRPKFEFDGD